MTAFARRIRPHVSAELAAAVALERDGHFRPAFSHLERAHVLGQASTFEHVRVHAAMLRWAIRRREPREIMGQLLRMAGAAALTPVGLVPRGNTGGADVSPWRPMPVPKELADLIAAASAPRR